MLYHEAMTTEETAPPKVLSETARRRAAIEAIDVLPFYDDPGSDAFNVEAYREAILALDFVPTTADNAPLGTERLRMALTSLCKAADAYAPMDPALAEAIEEVRALVPADVGLDAKWLVRLADAAEQMRISYNRALDKHGNTNPVLRDLRWPIGHLAVTREAALVAPALSKP